MPGDRYELALQAIALGAIGYYVKARLDEIKAELGDDLLPGERIPARLADGRKVGYVLRTDPVSAEIASVLNPGAFTRWVAENYPTEVETSVRPAFRDAVLNASRKAGFPISPNGEPDVPGITVNQTTAAAVVTVRPDYLTMDDALPAVLGQLRERVVGMLEAGGAG
jgi:hypothetical protein